MLAIEAKLKGTPDQYASLDSAIRTACRGGFGLIDRQTTFVTTPIKPARTKRNKCLRHWMDGQGVTRNDLQKLCSVLSKDTSTPWAKKLNSQARQAAADRAWQGIAKFYDNCKNPAIKKKGYPKFKKYNRSVEYKNTGWSLSPDRRQITFTDGFNAGTFDLWTSRDLVWYSEQQIKRVRVVKRADGYYCQFLVDIERKEVHEYTGCVTGIDLGLKEFYTDSNGNTVDNPRYLRKAEKRLKRLQKRLSRRYKKPTQKGQGQSKRYHKARIQLAKQHLKVSRQRKDHAIKTAGALVQSNDLVVYENLKVSNMVKNHKLAKSISDASWYQFCQWVAYYAKIHGIVCVAVSPHLTSQDCSNCGKRVQKSLSTRTHSCPHCHTVLDRDHNAAKNILAKGLNLLAEFIKSTVGHTGINAQGEDDHWLINGDVSHLSQLIELGIGENLESPSKEF